MTVVVAGVHAGGGARVQLGLEVQQVQLGVASAFSEIRTNLKGRISIKRYRHTFVHSDILVPKK